MEWEEVARAGGEGGDDEQAVLATLYQELHAIARRELDRGWRGGSVDSLDVLHEALLKLERTDYLEGRDRRDLLRVAPKMIRRLLVDRARRKNSVKRGGRMQRAELIDEVDGVHGLAEVDLLVLDEALERLELHRPEWARVVEERFFAGLDLDEIATLRGLPRTTIEHHWRMARAWLREMLE